MLYRLSIGLSNVLVCHEYLLDYRMAAIGQFGIRLVTFAMAANEAGTMDALGMLAGSLEECSFHRYSVLGHGCVYRCLFH